MKKETLFTHIGRPKAGLATPVSAPVTRASTLLFERAEDLYRSDIRGYGRHGSEVHDNLKDAFIALEGGQHCALVPSGLASCTVAIMACAEAGDHVLLTDSAYGPTYHFCQTQLKKMGVETTIYDPRIGAGIAALIKDNTKVILLESPGSLTFEIQDLPAICKAAKERGVTTIIDNTWSAGITLNPLSLGIDISAHAATKYFGGHSDILFGAIISNNKSLGASIDKTIKAIGFATSPDDAYQILRGFRTIMPRFRHSEASALQLATWLESRDEVSQVLHPALASHPDHNIWKRDFTGGACLFAIVLNPVSADKVLAFVNALKVFGIGYSYGGFESLCIHCDPQLRRDHGNKFDGPLIRFACGLEHVDDLQADIEQALAALR